VVESAGLRVWLSLGSNIEPRTHIRQALDELRKEFGELQISPIYESRAIGCEGDDFLNLVVGIETQLPVESLRSLLRAIETKLGRQRQSDKYAPRTLDIDLLTYGDLVVEGEGYRLPHDDITRYAFVLLPLSEVAGEEIHPRTGLSYRELWERFDDPSQDLWRV
jgi:2-amino-4-hydroxy-6-hydroxymethyldihydropteridine diphosphokinase